MRRGNGSTDFELSKVQTKVEDWSDVFDGEKGMIRIFQNQQAVKDDRDEEHKKTQKRTMVFCACCALIPVLKDVVPGILHSIFHLGAPMFKYGKLPAVRKPHHVALSDHLDFAHTWPAVPPQGWEFAVPASELSILGNDKYGDCACAGAYGLAQLQSCNANPSDPIVPTTAEALELYTNVTGFNPNDPDTDQGTVLTDLLTYWQKTGFEVTYRSEKKSVSQIVGWAALDISSFALMRWYRGTTISRKKFTETSGPLL